MLSWMYEPLITVQGLPVVVVVSIGGVVLVTMTVPFVAGVVRSVNVVDAVVVDDPRHSGVSAYLGHVRHRTASHCAFSRETKIDD